MDQQKLLIPNFIRKDKDAAIAQKLKTRITGEYLQCLASQIERMEKKLLSHNNLPHNNKECCITATLWRMANLRTKGFTFLWIMGNIRTTQTLQYMHYCTQWPTRELNYGNIVSFRWTIVLERTKTNTCLHFSLFWSIWKYIKR